METISYDRIKVIALPFAGGNKYSYKNIQKCLPQHMNWITLEIPGRGIRFKEKLLDDIQSLADDLFFKIKQHIQNEPYIIYGHSMGALLGYEVTKRIVHSNMELPECLFFTGSSAPSTLSKRKIAELPKKSFWKKIHDFGGLPCEVLKNEELLELYYPILRSDFRAIENYKYHSMKTLLPIPIFVCMGEDEIGENEGKVSIEKVKKWNEETIFPQKLQILHGDHFFVLKYPKVITHQINNAYQSIHTTNLVIK